MNLGVIFALLASVFWGFVYVIDQKILERMPVLKFLFYEHLLWVVFLTLYMLFAAKGTARLHQSDLTIFKDPYFLILIPATFIANILILKSIQNVGATTAVVLEISYPIFVALFSYLLFKQQVNRMTLLGGLLIFAGSAIVLYFNK